MIESKTIPATKTIVKVIAVCLLQIFVIFVFESSVSSLDGNRHDFHEKSNSIVFCLEKKVLGAANLKRKCQEFQCNSTKHQISSKKITSLRIFWDFPFEPCLSTGPSTKSDRDSLFLQRDLLYGLANIFFAVLFGSSFYIFVITLFTRENRVIIYKHYEI